MADEGLQNTQEEEKEEEKEEENPEDHVMHDADTEAIACTRIITVPSKTKELYGMRTENGALLHEEVSRLFEVL